MYAYAASYTSVKRYRCRSEPFGSDERDKKIDKKKNRNNRRDDKHDTLLYFFACNEKQIAGKHRRQAEHKQSRQP
jgi:hypothetical protein